MRILLGQTFLLCFCLLTVAGPVRAAVCNEVFSNAVGTTGGTLKLDNQPVLANTGNRILATDDLQASGKKANKICDNTDCLASGTPAPAPTLPPNSSSNDFNNSQLSFSAGDYYYDDFTLSGGQSVQLNVTIGTVRIHVAGKLVIDDAKANFGGAAEDLVFLVGGDVDIKDKAKVSALIYSEGAVVISGNATQLTGAVTGYSVEVKDKARVTFDPTAVDAADFNGFCSGTGGGNVDAAGFNCVVGGASALTGHLYLQKVGAAFTIDVVALADGDGDGTMDGVETGFAVDSDRSVTVELVDTSTGAACAARPSLTPAVAQSLTFTAGDNGRKAAAPMTVNTAYRSLGCRVSDTSVAPTLVACSTDTFVVRPTALTLAAPTLGNAGFGAGPRAIAGSPFSLTVSGGQGYTGTPLVDGSKLIAHAGAVTLGTLSGAFAAASSATGDATGSTFSYSEVGNFRFGVQALYDNGFAAEDIVNGDCTNDFSNVAVGGRFGCRFGNLSDSDWVGRFHPAQFEVVVSQHGVLAPGCSSSFSYQGDPVALTTPFEYRLTAKNLAGDTTENYTGDYAKLNTGGFTFDPISTDASQLGADGLNRVVAAWTAAGNRTLIDNGNGSHDLRVSDATFTWGRTANDLVAAFDTDLQIGLAGVADDDGVNGAGLPVSATPSSVEMRYGRVALSHAHGSELQHLNVPMRVEYFAGSGSGFVLNSADSCSNVAPIAIADLNTSDSLQVSETCIWDADNDSTAGCAGAAPAGMEFEAQAAAGLFNLNLRAPGVGNTGVLGVQATVPVHLRFDWLGNGDEDPSARATFGVFNRPSSIIFRREVR